MFMGSGWEQATGCSEQGYEALSSIKIPDHLRNFKEAAVMIV
jgi:hypothetical protein